MNSNIDWIKYGAGMVHLKNGNKKEAEEIFTSLIAECLSFAYPYEQLGYLRIKDGKTNQAHEWFSKAIERMPENEMGLYHRGLLQVELKRFEDAANSFLRVLEMNLLHTEAMVELALVFGRKDDFKKATSLIRDVYQKNKTKKDCFARLGWLRGENRDWEGAFEIVNRDYNEDRISPAWQMNLAQLVGRLGDWDSATDMIKQSYEIQPNLKDGYARLGWIKLEVRQRCAAKELFEKDRRSGRLSPAWVINLALLYGLLKDFMTASDLIMQAYQADKTIMDGFSRLGWIGYLVGKGVAFFHEQIKKDEALNRQSTRSPFYHALHIVAAGSKADNFNDIETIYNEMPGKKNFLAAIGWLCLRLGKTERGVELMARNQDLGNMDPTWLPSYAAALGICGRTEQALNILEQTYTGESDDEAFSIGYIICPDAVLSATQLRQLISRGMTHKDIFNNKNARISLDAERSR